MEHENDRQLLYDPPQPILASPHDRTVSILSREAAGVLEDALDREMPSEDEAGLLLLPFWKEARCESLRCRSGSRTEQRPLVALPINVRRPPVQPATIDLLRGEGKGMNSDVGEERYGGSSRLFWSA